jgi:hypothetical protein
MGLSRIAAEGRKAPIGGGDSTFAETKNLCLQSPRMVRGYRSSDDGRLATHFHLECPDGLRNTTPAHEEP